MSSQANDSPRLREVAKKYPECPLCKASDEWSQGPAIDVRFSSLKNQFSMFGASGQVLGTLICGNCGFVAFLTLDEP